MISFINPEEVINQNFLSKVREIVICILCNGILRLPSQCKICKESFCKQCIDEYFLKKRQSKTLNKTKCPSCTKGHLDVPEREIPCYLNLLRFKLLLKYSQRCTPEYVPKELFYKQSTICSRGKFIGDNLNSNIKKFGIHYGRDGSVYKGYMKKNMRHGIGIQTYANGDSLQGKWVEDFVEGYGIYRWNDGTVYEGEFVHGFRNGIGIQREINGECYEGDWINEKKEGYGKIVYKKNNAIHEGAFNNNKKNGYGQYLIPGDSLLQSIWMNGTHHFFNKIFISYNEKINEIVLLRKKREREKQLSDKNETKPSIPNHISHSKKTCKIKLNVHTIDPSFKELYEIVIN